MGISKNRITQFIIIALATGGGVPFMSVIGIDYSFSRLTFLRQTILAITIECGLYFIISWIVGNIYKIVLSLFIQRSYNINR
jgi:hypothetical protein